ncbi:hypothetical protein [Candidimonas nitroreducens]|uniref:Uncharacterized protein n=1 Tax=Candidimonas nitroreducens TaxID=683354 RepID=A0A225N477_9BURK|nr:hypothetical protein [Candidimonas nitroreducens]OWT65819.1 hypothetical protein CEY11_03575 [Candidimonas nitroreducens]
MKIGHLLALATALVMHLNEAGFVSQAAAFSPIIIMLVAMGALVTMKIVLARVKPGTSTEVQ